MAYFNYHQMAQKLIKSGHCTHAEIVEKHNAISPALILYFNNHKPMPIREEKWLAYFKILEENSIKITTKNTH